MDKYTATELAYKHGYEKGYEAGKRDATDTNVGSKWIPVSERLPEPGKDVLCLKNTGFCWLAVWNFCEDQMWSDGEFWCSETGVTHWMPLPEPTKEEPHITDQTIDALNKMGEAAHGGNDNG